MFTFLKELVFFLILSILIWLFAPVETVDNTSLQIPPKPTASSGIYVQDNAGVFSASVSGYLQSLGRQLDQKTTAQLVVVTVPSLKGAPLEDYSLQILRQWGIGNKEKNNGVLMLISTGDRKSRIEVGYGLEGALTDGVTGQIQDQYMIPYFRKGNYEEGIARGYEALARRIAKEARTVRQRKSCLKRHWRSRTELLSSPGRITCKKKRVPLILLPGVPRILHRAVWKQMVPGTVPIRASMQVRCRVRVPGLPKRKNRKV